MAHQDISDTLTALLRLRGETRERNYPGRSDDEIFEIISRKIRRRSPLGSVACRTGALALRQRSQSREH